MKKAEELFHLQKDSLELKNEASNPEYANQLRQMRSLYDKHLTHWKLKAHPENDYTRFGKLFDRQIPWDQKVLLWSK